MASIGHIAVGLAAGRIHSPAGAGRKTLIKAMVALSAISMAPDADVIAFSLGIPYGAPFGHRGATHSIGAAVLAGLIAWALSRPLKLSPLRTSAIVAGVVLSHPLLDMLTTGGYGCAIFWPFSDERFFFPIHVIPVAPIGLYMFSGYGLMVVLVETVMFLPLFIFATFPRRSRPVTTGSPPP